MKLSLRKRLFSGVVFSTALLLCIFCIIVYSVTSNMLTRQFDNSLLSMAEILSAGVEINNIEEESHNNNNEEHEHPAKTDINENANTNEIEFEFDLQMAPKFNTLNGGSYYQFWTGNGELIASSPSLGKSKLPLFKDDSNKSIFRACILPDGNKGRAISYRVAQRIREEGQVKDDQYFIIVAHNASQIYNFLTFLKWLLLNCSIVTVILSSIIAIKVASIGLRPVHMLAGEIESINEKELQITLPPEAYPAELVPICVCLNELMDRIKRSFERERQFNADVAHELRTPLSGIQSTIEVCLSRQRDKHEYKEALENSLAICKALSRLVTTLLFLSKLESKKIVLEKQQVNLNELIENTWQLYADKAYDKKIIFENKINNKIFCHADKDHINMIISNILDNAVEYCNEEGNIIVDASANSEMIKLAICNTGCNLKPEETHRIFDFFWRANIARTDTGLHCGVGLAVVKKIADVLGIKVDAEIKDDSIFSIILKLPVDNYSN